jgi:exosortase
LLLLPLRVIFEINADWPLICWVYSIMVVGLTLFAFHLAGGWTWVRHFAFPVAFILVAIAWPYRIEKGLTQDLMQVVASLTVELLGWLNIPAMQQGNLIALSTGTVGIDEACSGIRSFQSSLMAGLLMGELYRLRLWTRVGLVGCGIGLAFGFNVVRTLLLTWQADKHGLSAIDKWHDPAGMSITVACFLGLWAVATLIERKWGAAGQMTEDRGQKTEDRGQSAVISDQSSVISSPQSEGCPPSSVLRPLSSVLCPPSSVLRSPSSASLPVVQPSAFSLQPSALPLVLRPPSSPREMASSPISPGQRFSVSALNPASSAPSLSATDGERAGVRCQDPSSVLRPPSSVLRYLLAIGCWAILCLAATEAWYRSHAVKDEGTFHWSVVLPESKPGFQKVTMTPRTEKLISADLAATGKWQEEDGSEWTAYFFRWHPRSIQSVIMSRVHRPEVCLPASGLRQVGDSKPVTLEAGALPLPFRAYTYEAEGKTLHVFFCQWEDGSEKQAGMGASGQADRLKSVLTGRRKLGQQTLEFIITGHRTLDEATQALGKQLPSLIRIETEKAQNKTLKAEFCFDLHFCFLLSVFCF